MSDFFPHKISDFFIYKDHRFSTFVSSSSVIMKRQRSKTHVEILSVDLEAHIERSKFFIKGAVSSLNHLIEEWTLDLKKILSEVNFYLSREGYHFCDIDKIQVRFLHFTHNLFNFSPGENFDSIIIFDTYDFTKHHFDLAHRYQFVGSELYCYSRNHENRIEQQRLEVTYDWRYEEVLKNYNHLFLRKEGEEFYFYIHGERINQSKIKFKNWDEWDPSDMIKKLSFIYLCLKKSKIIQENYALDLIFPILSFLVNKITSSCKISLLITEK